MVGGTDGTGRKVELQIGIIGDLQGSRGGTSALISSSVTSVSWRFL